ncbi:MAG: ANTAR domain-containing response regulator [Faecousia sp.]
MATRKKQYRVLVAGFGDKLGNYISDLLPKPDYEVAAICDSVSKVRRTLLDQNIDLVIMNTPLREEFGTQLALDLAEENLGVLLLVPGDVYDQVCYKVEDHGVFTLPKPVSRDGLFRAVKLLTAMRGKLLQMDKKQQTLKEKMQDIRTVNQAKWLLVSHLHMSESDAHYFIEKKAMDSRLSSREVAEDIIHSYI